jgi:uncharacterized protein YjbI with pentapeptide repeats
VLVVVVLPPRFTAHRTFDKDHEELKAQNDVRTTLLQGLGALLVLTGAAIGASVAYRGVQETRRQIAQTAADNQQQFTLTRQGQITDRYTKAVEQLGHEKAPVRLGALYSLERLAQNNPEHRQTVVDVVCAYLRMPYTPPPRSDRPLIEVETFGPPRWGSYEQHTAAMRSAEHQTFTADDPDPALHPAPKQDPNQEELQVRQTAQRIIAAHLQLPERTSGTKAQRRRPSPRWAFWPGISLDLTGAALVDLKFWRVSAIQAHFEGATFHGTAMFGQATFQNAWFDRASFTGEAWFRTVTFQRDAWFLRATFHGVAWFNGATFRGDAWFGEASFPGTALFEDVTFHGKTGFNEVTFHRGARFFMATFQDQAPFGKTIFGGEAWFGAATFKGVAWFDGATFQGRAWFGQATFQGDTRFAQATFQGDAQFGEATFTGDTGLGVAGAEVLHVDDPDLNNGRVWPNGCTVRPDPADPTRGTLVPTERVEAPESAVPPVGPTY